MEGGACKRGESPTVGADMGGTGRKSRPKALAGRSVRTGTAAGAILARLQGLRGAAARPQCRPLRRGGA
jgi:hypothetical protein